MHMNKKIKHPHKIGILMWFGQLHAYIHRQHQPTISNINHMHYNSINQHTHTHIHKNSQISQIHKQNLLQTQTRNLKSPIQPKFSPTHNKQTLIT